jgi:hypothetical protein
MLLSCYLQLSQYVKELRFTILSNCKDSDDVLIANQQASFIANTIYYAERLTPHAFKKLSNLTLMNNC